MSAGSCPREAAHLLHACSSVQAGPQPALGRGRLRSALQLEPAPRSCSGLHNLAAGQHLTEQEYLLESSTRCSVAFPGSSAVMLQPELRASRGCSASAKARSRLSTLPCTRLPAAGARSGARDLCSAVVPLPCLSWMGPGWCSGRVACQRAAQLDKVLEALRAGVLLCSQARQAGRGTQWYTAAPRPRQASYCFDVALPSNGSKPCPAQSPAPSTAAVSRLSSA